MSQYTEEILEWAMEMLVKKAGRLWGVVHPDSICIEVGWANFVDTAECCNAQYEDEDCTCVEDGYERAIKISGVEPLHHYYMRSDGNSSRYHPKVWVMPSQEPRFEYFAEEINRANGH